jgi:hypothetical protein
VPKKDPGKQGAQHRGADDFTSVAKSLGCNDDKAQFEAKLGKLAKAKGPKK